MTYYKENTILAANAGNNAFSYDDREKIIGRKPSLIVPSIMNGTINDVCVGEDIVFEEVEEGILKSCRGLRKFVRIKDKEQDGGREIIIFDNHNHAYYFWAEARSRGLIRDGATLIHIDQHKDMRDPEIYQKNEDLNDLGKVATYTNEVLNVGNFIIPAREAGMIKDIFLLDAEQHFDQDFSQISGNLIVDIDLDMFAPELDFMDQKMILEKTRELVAKASFVTMATSPFFIEQEEAIEWARKIFL
ncbi:MAG: UPF0489 family protein [Candidatus Gracilibacteria bacterium]